MVRRSVSPVDGTSVKFLEVSNSDVLSEVDVSGNGGCSNVEPIRVVRSELLVGSGLDDVDPGGDLEFTWNRRKRMR